MAPLPTDTWLGGKTAALVRDWLEQSGLKAQILEIRDLRTDRLEGFQLALAEIVKWCAEVIPGYSQQGYHVVFNLTGGFKSIQGFLQALAMFYADEAIYVFESSQELLRLPRLPVRMSAAEEVSRSLNSYRRLALGLTVTEPPKVAETLLMRVGKEVARSPWGELVWQQEKGAIYQSQLHSPPSPQIRFGPDFGRSLDKLPARRIQQINERVDDLARYLEKDQTLNRLDIKSIQGGEMLPSTHEMDAWADEDAHRLFGHFEGECFVLDRLGKALH